MWPQITTSTPVRFQGTSQRRWVTQKDTPPRSMRISRGNSCAQPPQSLLPRTPYTGARRSSSSITVGSSKSPAWRMQSTSRRRSAVSGRRRPWVSEITPMRIAVPPLILFLNQIFLSLPGKNLGIATGSVSNLKFFLILFLSRKSITPPAWRQILPPSARVFPVQLLCAACSRRSPPLLRRWSSYSPSRWPCRPGPR